MFFYYYDEEKDTTVPMELDDSKLNTVDLNFSMMVSVRFGICRKRNGIFLL